MYTKDMAKLIEDTLCERSYGAIDIAYNCLDVIDEVMEILSESPYFDMDLVEEIIEGNCTEVFTNPSPTGEVTSYSEAVDLEPIAKGILLDLGSMTSEVDENSYSAITYALAVKSLFKLEVLSYLMLNTNYPYMYNVNI